MYDTIAALITPPGTGAIGVIRISGVSAVKMAERLFTPNSGTLSEAPERTLIGGMIHDGGKILDYPLCAVFRGARSYTGEDSVELHCHGSPIVLSRVLSMLYERGVRPAAPGEFSRRAFLHGKMDLTRAEAVMDIITAESVEAAKNAGDHLGGSLAHAVGEIYAQLTAMLAHFGAMVDYPGEDIVPLDRTEAVAEMTKIAAQITALRAGYERGRTLREGYSAAIVGRPNVGKSSLMNRLAGYDRVIVSDSPGTTRDTVELSMVVGGMLLRVQDTAGLRHTADKLELQGILRARAALENAGLLFVVLDGSEPLTEDDRQILDQVQDRHAIIVVNKSDLPVAIDMQALEAAFLHVCPVSASTGAGIDNLETQVRRICGRRRGRETGVLAGQPLITNARHAGALERCLKALKESKKALKRGLPPDVVMSDLELSLHSLGEITGRSIHADMLEQIFSQFCVGK